MTRLQTALAILSNENESITAEQRLLVDEALSSANCDQIPESDVPNAIGYIDRHLVHNSVSQEIEGQLDRLHDELVKRWSAS